MDIKLFGYNKKLVQKQFNDIDMENKKEIENLLKTIEEQKKYKANLTGNLNEILDELKRLEKEKKLLSLAKDKKIKIENHLNKVLDEEIEELTKDQKEKIDKLNIGIENKKKEIQKLNESFSELAKSMLSFLNGVEEKGNIKQKEKNEEYIKNKAFCKVIPFNKKDNESTKFEKERNIEAEKINNENKDKIVMPKSSKKEKENEFWEINEEKVTADGSNASHIDKLNFSPKENSSFSEDNKKERQEIVKNFRVFDEPAEKTELISGFWSDINDKDEKPEKPEKQFKVNKLENRTMKPEEQITTTEKSLNSLETQTLDEAAAVIETINEKISDKDTNNSSKETIINEKTNDSKLTSHQTDQEIKGGSKIISEEIKNIRFKYIAGKIAGEDIISSSGQLIVKKGKVITEDIIIKAEEEGKLSDLIVNMILPGMD